MKYITVFAKKQNVILAIANFIGVMRTLDFYRILLSVVICSRLLGCRGWFKIQESPAVADKPARRLRNVCTVYVRAVGLQDV